MPTNEQYHHGDEVQHTVTLKQGFWLSDHEVTQAEYQAVMGRNPSFHKADTRPVEMVSWDDSVLYCQKLTERERAAGRITAQQAYRLPTEAEWEYAARSGTTGERYGDLDAIAWYSYPGLFRGESHAVKEKQPSAWGLYDMLGNVAEWCADWYGDYPTGSASDPTGPNSGSIRVVRGGSWNAVAEHTRSANRGAAEPIARDSDLGFRVVLGSVR
jgi:formylglycine-generating enzyme required for sulfatase activity